MVLEASVDFSDISISPTPRVGGSRAFWVWKRGFDVVGALALLPIVLVCMVALVLLNPFLNPGAVFFSQVRMGRGCKPFTAYKFRSMRAAGQPARGTEEPLEHDRITRFGKFLRKTRIDELPQVFNVLRGEMSLIGPRPDYIHHARSYLRQIPEYRRRHDVRPGISGYSQVHLGYVIGTEATRDKTRGDLHYIQNAGFAMDLQLVLGTVRTVLTQSGA
ncbi:sugar transferase [Aliiroseovarius sp.]|uniref:sugar transferase n=1 Tax=Aliiroseovarius sp. TaxID=1872442 RepID=UPI003BA9F957